MSFYVVVLRSDAVTLRPTAGLPLEILWLLLVSLLRSMAAPRLKTLLVILILRLLWLIPPRLKVGILCSCSLCSSLVSSRSSSSLQLLLFFELPGCFLISVFGSGSQSRRSVVSSNGFLLRKVKDLHPALHRPQRRRSALKVLISLADVHWTDILQSGLCRKRQASLRDSCWPVCGLFQHGRLTSLLQFLYHEARLVAYPAIFGL